MINEFLIIGAGLSGLSLALELKKAGKQFLILEKSKGVGGRIATRRINNLGVDHGAPYLKGHPELFELTKHFHIHDGKIANEGIYLEGGMTTLPKKMAEHLPVIKDEKVIQIEFLNGIWICKCEKGNIHQAKKLIITSPIPQAIELLETSEIDFSYKTELKSISYIKGLLGIFLIDEEALIKKELPENVHSVLSMKTRKLNPAGWVIRTTEEFSEKNFNKPDEENLSQIESLFIRCFGQSPKISHSELKKWRYVTPKSVIPHPFLEVQRNLFLVGDGFLYPDVRGALLSAKGLAENLI